MDSIENSGIRITDSIQLLPENTIGEKHWGIVPLSVINIRSEPDFTAEMITQATLGTPVKILDREKGWLLVQTPDRYIGWTNTSVRLMNEKEFKSINRKKKLIVNDYNTVIYECPSKQSLQVMEVLAGNILVQENKKKQGDFRQVSLPGGKTGFVPVNSVKTFSAWQKSIRLTGDNIAEYSKKFLGLPYLWGGTSSRGVDCSGFTKTVFFMHGLILPRDASQQFHTGSEVDISAGFSNLKTGDLLFFGQKDVANPGHFKVVHVAIYIGNLRFIHSSEYVRISSLDPESADYDRYNAERLIGVRRIIGTGMKGIGNVFTDDWYN